MPIRNIAVVTGTRAEYGLLRSVMREIAANPHLKLSVVASGMHLSKTFGETVSDIRRDGFPLAAVVHMTPAGDSSAAMATSVGVGIEGMVRAFKKIQPDIVVVLGDRVEALAATLAAAYMNIAVAHIHGGDKSQAGLDESARHAITKFAHLHFPATKKSASRILKLGENKKHIYISGAPGLDEVLHQKRPARAQLMQRYHITDSEPVALLLQHPVSTDPRAAKIQIQESLDALVALKLQTVIIYPNADAGGREMIQVIRRYAAKYPFLHAYANIDRADFLGLMAEVNVMLGNSSSGIIESSSFKLPVINIGVRQTGRERALNVLDVPPQKEKIMKALKKALSDKKFLARVRTAKNPYGNGVAGKRIARELAGFPLDPGSLQKHISY